MKNLVAVTTLVSFGGGIALLAYANTDATAAPSDAGLISNVSTNDNSANGVSVPGLGSPDASGFFTFSDQGAASPTASANDGTTNNDNITATPQPQPRVRSRSS